MHVCKRTHSLGPNRLEENESLLDHFFHSELILSTPVHLFLMYLIVQGVGILEDKVLVLQLTEELGGPASDSSPFARISSESQQAFPSRRPPP